MVGCQLRRTIVNWRVVVDVLQVRITAPSACHRKESWGHRSHSCKTAHPVLLGEAVGTVALAFASRRIVLCRGLAASVSP